MEDSETTLRNVVTRYQVCFDLPYTHLKIKMRLLGLNAADWQSVDEHIS
jgi:hypothetical protein